jgi:hypothetical protein
MHCALALRRIVQYLFTFGMRESEVPKRNGDAKNRLHLFFCGYSSGAFFITSIAQSTRYSFTEYKKFDTIGDISRERTTGEKTDGKE